MWQPGWEGSLGENGYICVCMAESLCYPPEITTTLLIRYTPIQTIKLKKKMVHSIIAGSFQSWLLSSCRVWVFATSWTVWTAAHHRSFHLLIPNTYWIGINFNFFFFWMQTIFTVFIESATILLLFYVLVFLVIRHVGSLLLTRDWTSPPCTGRWSLNYQTPIVVLAWMLMPFIDPTTPTSNVTCHSMNPSGLWPRGRTCTFHFVPTLFCVRISCNGIICA